MNVGIAVAGLHHDVESRGAVVGLPDQLESFEPGETPEIEVDTECVVFAVLENRAGLLELFGTSDPATAKGECRLQQFSGCLVVVDDEYLCLLSDGCVKGGCLGHARPDRKPAANPEGPGQSDSTYCIENG